MSDQDAVVGVAAAITAAIAAVGAARMWRTWGQYHGTMLVTCPETRLPAVIRLANAGIGLAAVTGKPALWLSDCSQWPEKRGCAKGCTASVAADSEPQRIWALVQHHYEGTACGDCGQEIRGVKLVAHVTALRAPDGSIREWTSVSEDQLEELFKAHTPICWNCQVAEAFRQQYPDLVTSGARGRR